MSTTVDERVLEMRFDNKQFEANVQTSMSTLAKLKQSLNLTGASKGLENINAAAKNNNLSALGNAAETVGLKFNGMYTMADQALRNITNRVQHTAERMVSALTIDPIKTGFQEYETQINAVQTILANTSHNGTTIDQVNEALDTLNQYADKTIYNFTEMTRNIGTFTAAGVDLQTSVDSIQGIANLAAVSGSTSQQASTAMYQLSQALAAGKVSLMDWNSVVNAGMGGKVFQDALVRTSELLGTGAQAAIDTYGSFRESLTQGEWLTTEVLTETLKQFAGAYTEAELIQQGFSAEQAKSIADMAKTAEDAATKVKTFTQLWDVMKESAQSGWSQTWKLLIGDFEEAKSLLTPLADFMTNVINKMSEARNAVLESALANRFKSIGDTIKTITKPIENSAESIKGVVKSVEEYSKVVDEIIGGKWGNGQARWDKLTEAGYDWAHAQNLVNEKLGNAKRHATDYKEAQNGVADAQKKASESTGEYIARLTEYTDRQLLNKGLTAEQVKALRALEKQSEKTGIPIADLVENIDLLNGRTLLINAFKNAGDGLVGTFKAMKGAWQAVFPPKSTEERAASLYNFIAAMHKFSLNLRLTDSETGELTDTAKDLMSTFKGVFAILDIVATIAGGGLRIAFKILSGILKYFDMDILDLTANIGEAIYEFRNWFKSIFNIDGAIEKIIPILVKGAEAIKGWGKAFLELPFVQKIIDKITGAFDKIKDYDFSNFGSDFIDTIVGWGEVVKGWIDAFKEIPQVQKIIAKLKEEFSGLKDINIKEIAASIAKDLIEGLKLGLDADIPEVIKKIIDLGIKILTAICDVLGIESPSKEMFSIGQFIIEGLVNGIIAGATWVIDTVKSVAGKIVDAFKGADWNFNTEGLESAFAKFKELIGKFDWKKLLAVIPIGAVLLLVKKIYDISSTLANGIDGINDVIENFALIEKKFAKVLSSFALNIKAKAFKNLAVALAIVVGSVIALTLVDTDKLWDAVGVITWLAVLLGIMAFAISKMSDTSASIGKDGLNIEGIKASLISIGAAILLLGITAKLLGSMNTDEYTQGMLGLVVIMGSMALFVAACSKLGDIKTAAVMSKFGGMILQMSIAMILLVGVCKLVGKLSPDEIIKGIAAMAIFVIFVGALIEVTTIGKDDKIAEFGGMILKISIAMALMVGVCKLVAKLTQDEIVKGIVAMAVFVVFVGALIEVTKIGEKDKIAKLGSLLLSISVSMILMIGVCKLAAKLTLKEAVAGAVFMGAFLLMIKALIKITTITKKQQIAKLTGVLLAMSVAIAILAGVAILLGMVPTDMLVRGVGAVVALGAIMTAMIWATRGAKKCVGNLIVMTVAVAILVGAVAVLSTLDPERLKRSVAALVIVMGVFAGMIAITKLLKNSKSMRKTLLTMVAVTAVLAGIIAGLSFIDSGAALKSTVALVVLLGAFVGAMVILGKAGKISSTVTKTLGPMMLVVLELAGILAVLSVVGHFTKDGSMLEAATALSVLMLAFAGAMVIIGHTGRISATVRPLLQPMVLVVLELAGILAVLSIVAHFTKDGSMLEAATSLSILLLALSASMVILGHVNPLAKTAVGSAALLGLVLAELVLVLWMMQALNITPSIETAAALSILLIALSGACVILGVAGTFGAAAFVGIGVLAALIVGIGGLVIAIGALATKFPQLQEFLDTGIPILEKIGYALGSFFGNIVGGFASGVTSKLPDIGTDLSNFMTNLGPFIEGAKTIDESAFGGIKRLMEALAGIGLTSVGLSIADIWTNILGDQTAMEKFAEDGVAFFKAMKTISTEMTGFAFPEDFSAENIKTIISAISSVATLSIGTSLADIFTQKIGDQTAMEKFEADGKAFFKAIKAIAVEMTGFAFPEDFSVEGLTKLLDALKAVGNRMIGLSIADLFAGKDQTAMEKFGVDGAAFFKSIKAISVEMTGFTFPEDFSVEGLTTLLDALKSVGNRMIGLSIADLFAGNDQTAMEKFETDAKAFFKTIKGISTEMTGFVLPEGFSKDAIIKLLDVLKSVGSYTIGASWGDIFTLGGTTMEKFQSDGTTFFSTLKTISTEASGINVESINIAKNAVSRIKSIIESVSGIDYSGVAEFTGIGTGGFGADGPMHDIGKAIKDFSSTVSGIDLAAVKVSVSAATNLKKLIVSLVGLDTSGVSLFNPKSIGDKILSYSNSVSSINAGAITNSINIANRLKNFISSLAGLDTSGVSSFKSAISSLSKTSFGDIEKTFNSNAGKMASIGTKLIDSISKGMQSKQSALVGTTNKLLATMIKVVTSRNTAFVNAARNLMSNFVKGIQSMSPMVSRAMFTSLASAITAATGYYTSFHSAGGYLADGFANGISANSYKAAAKARAMAQAAKQAAEAALGIHSPSKVFYKIGDYTGQGFINALTDYGSKVYSVSSDMANSARDGLTAAISRIADVINGDLDTQPTIRPVLDLSNVEAGVGTLNGLMSNNSIGVVSNLNAINSMMSRRNQNGANADVVSAINKLDKHLDNVGGNYYNVNGVTYDDGSAIKGAIETIVRAAKIERRS